MPTLLTIACAVWLGCVAVLVGGFAWCLRPRPSSDPPAMHRRHPSSRRRHPEPSRLSGRRPIPKSSRGVHTESNKLLTVKDVADFVAISTKEVWRKADAGQLPKPLHLGGELRRWLREEVEAVIEQAKWQREC